MEKVEKSLAWKNSIGRQDPANQVCLDKLRASFIAFREKASFLASEVHRFLPEYTVHDISHIDALWEMTDIVCGPEFKLNPVEGFVLGGAFLLHDLAMSLSAYPNGLEDLESLDLWRDTLVQKQKADGLSVNPDAPFESLSKEHREYVLSVVLRKLHANTAESLATRGWHLADSETEVFLIEDVELRNNLAPIIGQIAHSHWWDIDKLEQEFSRIIGAPSWAPRNWTIDPLKIACVLRVTDASHIDARRAPIFLSAVRKLNKVSKEHWKFQEKLQKPYLVEDSICYTSASTFAAIDAASWWLCFETLSMIDGELRRTDALLAGRSLERFAARRVFGIDSAERLATLIRTQDWMPIDANIHIGDLPSIIRSIGGEELYGKNLETPLRELIQNSADAIRARRMLEKRDVTWGEILIYLTEADCLYLEITDTGLGMSLDVVRRCLLEFGTSYWDSELMQEEHPGLTSLNLNHTGKYGIGFFSVFMIADDIKVVTRKCTKSHDESFVVEINQGLNSRPLVRKATQQEIPMESGTSVKVKIKDVAAFKKLFQVEENKSISLCHIIQKIAPAIDCDLKICEYDSPEEKIKANNWLECSNREFVDLICKFDRYGSNHVDSFSEEHLTTLADNLTSIINDEDETIGRAVLTGSQFTMNDDVLPHLNGKVVVGGLSQSSTYGVAGIFLGNPVTAARNTAEIVASEKMMAAWATKQAELAASTFLEETQIDISQIVRMLHGDPGPLKIAFNFSQYFTFDELVLIVKNLDRVILCSDFFVRYESTRLKKIVISEGVFFAAISSMPSLFSYDRNRWDSFNENWSYEKTSLGYFCEIVSKAWEIPIEIIKETYREGSISREKALKIGQSMVGDIYSDGYEFLKEELQPS